MHAKVQRVRMTLRLSKWRKGVEKEGFGVCRADNYPVEWSVNHFNWRMKELQQQNTENKSIDITEVEREERGSHRSTPWMFYAGKPVKSKVWTQLDVNNCLDCWKIMGRLLFLHMTSFSVGNRNSTTAMCNLNKYQILRLLIFRKPTFQLCSPCCKMFSTIPLCFPNSTRAFLSFTALYVCASSSTSGED